MRYKRLDLNLLVALDALLDERNTTKAAHRLSISQSAMSGMLSRLRDYFEDDLMVQVGRAMQRTPLGDELAGPVRELLIGTSCCALAVSKICTTPTSGSALTAPVAAS